MPVKLFLNNQQLLIEQSIDSNIFILDNLYQLKKERSNCPKFSKYLSSEIDIFVNDAFSQCHRTLASTVGVAGFCNSRIAGFCFEDDLHQLKEVFRTTKNPYVAIVCFYLVYNSHSIKAYSACLSSKKALVLVNLHLLVLSKEKEILQYPFLAIHC